MINEMRILLLHSRPLDLANSIGGVPEFLKAITGEFQQLGLDVTIYAGHKSFDKVQQAGCLHNHVRVFSGPLVEPGFWVPRNKLRQVAAFCRQEQFSVLHSQGTYTPGFMCREIFHAIGTPYIVTSHSDVSPVNSMRIKRHSVRARYRKILKDAAWVTHLTPVMEEASHQLFNTSEKSSLIHNGINAGLWKPYQKAAEKNYLLGIGRLERGKGFHILIEMFAELMRRKVNTSLVIAGSGEAEAELIQQAKQLGLSVLTHWQDLEKIPERSVVFTGYVRGDDKYQLMAQSQFVLFATQPDLWEEAFGLVQLEAMAAAKPLIASDIQAVRYLASLGMQAEIVPPRDVQAWADAAQKLLQDSVKRKAMSDANAIKVEQFSWRQSALEYEKVYRRVCGEASSSTPSLTGES